MVGITLASAVNPGNQSHAVDKVVLNCSGSIRFRQDVAHVIIQVQQIFCLRAVLCTRDTVAESVIQEAVGVASNGGTSEPVRVIKGKTPAGADAVHVATLIMTISDCTGTLNFICIVDGRGCIRGCWNWRSQRFGPDNG